MCPLPVGCAFPPHKDLSALHPHHRAGRSSAQRTSEYSNDTKRHSMSIHGQQVLGGRYANSSRDSSNSPTTEAEGKCYASHFTDEKTKVRRLQSNSLEVPQRLSGRTSIGPSGWLTRRLIRITISIKTQSKTKIHTMTVGTMLCIRMSLSFPF